MPGREDMSCRKATTASTYGMGLPAMFAPNTVGGHSICPRCMEFHLNNRRRTPEPALCKGRCRVKRGGGVVSDTNYLLFLFCKLQNFTIPQALPRQLPLHKGAFLVCANIAGGPCRKWRRTCSFVCSPQARAKGGFLEKAPS